MKIAAGDASKGALQEVDGSMEVCKGWCEGNTEERVLGKASRRCILDAMFASGFVSYMNASG